MSDLISRGIENALAILDAVNSSGRMDYYSDYCALHDAISSIEVPSEQPIIHCKDCAYADSYYQCQNVMFYTSKDDYCSRGKMKNE